MESQGSLVDKHPFEEKRFELIEKVALKDEDDIYRLQKTASENIEDRPSDECGREFLNNDISNNATNEKNLQHNFSINQPEYDNVEKEPLRENETRLTSINQHRSEGIKSLKRQAAKMLQQSCCKYSEVEIGQNVLIKIPDVDRGCLAPRIAYYLKEKIYTNLARQLDIIVILQPSQTTTLASSDIPIDKKFSLRTVATKESNSAQGFLRCNCRKQCGDKKCKGVLDQIKCT
ncbi:hypothetical protein ILUMI_06684 [Ignelater luminosus]|uniref:Uncharacterized protein n=1 Tax=Ignelater luminosus TaxID=2038154 RepID=A0A8K0GHI6_IGNLU|nr:hypothetical protein ILUMI_06684 [Ignelater luminosus]